MEARNQELRNPLQAAREVTREEIDEGIVMEEADDEDNNNNCCYYISMVFLFVSAIFGIFLHYIFLPNWLQFVRGSIPQNVSPFLASPYPSCLPLSYTGVISVSTEALVFTCALILATDLLAQGLYKQEGITLIIPRSRERWRVFWFIPLKAYSMAIFTLLGYHYYHALPDEVSKETYWRGDFTELVLYSILHLFVTGMWSRVGALQMIKWRTPANEMNDWADKWDRRRLFGLLVAVLLATLHWKIFNFYEINQSITTPRECRKLEPTSPWYLYFMLTSLFLVHSI